MSDGIKRTGTAMSATNRGASRIDADNYPTPAWCVHRLLEAVSLPYGEWLEPCAGEGAIVKAVQSYSDHLEMVQPHRKRGVCSAITAIDIRPECEAPLRALGTASEAGSPYRVRVSAGCDYLKWGAPSQPGGGGVLPRFAVTITNPPYSLAEPIIRKALTHSNVVCMLLRLNFWGGEESRDKLDRGRQSPYQAVPSSRVHLLDEHPADTYVLPNRPSFVVSTKCGTRKGEGCGWGELAPLDAPPFASCPECGGKVRRSSSDATEYAWFVWDQRRQTQLYTLEDKGPYTYHPPPGGRIVRLASTPLEERRAA